MYLWDGLTYSMIQSMLLLVMLQKPLTNKKYFSSSKLFISIVEPRAGGYWSFLSFKFTPHSHFSLDVFVGFRAGLREQKSTDIQTESMIEKVENEGLASPLRAR